MKPVAITFVDKKFRKLAEDQAENFQKFNLEHVIIDLPEVSEYDVDFWLMLIDLSKKAIKQYGKIFRVDAEIRIHKDLPQSWIEADNVLFYFDPLIKYPWYVAINTGHMILSEKGNGLKFLETLQECILATIPPDNDTSLKAAGIDQRIEDEWPSAIAIRLSGIEHLKETLCQERELDIGHAATRGLWVTEKTIFTHPAIHNWALPGSGNWKGAKISDTVFINHFSLNDLKKAKFVSKLLLQHNANKNIWTSLGANIEGDIYSLEGWKFRPTTGQCAPDEFWDVLPKELVVNH